MRMSNLILFSFSNRATGLFEFRRPVVLIRDPKLVKHLAVKDFDHFMDHRVLITEELDPMFGKTLVSLQGQKWKGQIS
jgi:cytochrome P450 family 9